MQINLDKIACLYHGEMSFDMMPSLKFYKPFSDEMVSFLYELSYELLNDREAKGFPDVITFAFFCRKSNIERERDKFFDCTQNRIGRGVSFHIAPSNVPVNFAYSMVAGLLSGNACIIRVSTKPFPQVDIICRAICKIFASEKHDKIKEYIAIVRYERDADITAYFSSFCDVRIIWGGDGTIEEIRKAVIPPRAFDITFADRYSLCVINAENYLKETNPQKIAQGFYNDTYLYDQNACSSPHLMVWIGPEKIIVQAKEQFWKAIHEYVQSHYFIESVIIVDKLITVCRCAIGLEGARREDMPDNLISRIHVDKLTRDIPDYRCAGGSFVEYDDVNFDALASIITRKYQTMAYIGFQPEEVKNWVIDNGLLGIDRIVPVGKTANFKLFWDGYDLIRTLSRICNIE